MARAATARKPAKAPDRRSLASALIDLRKQNDAVFRKFDELKVGLKAVAKDLGANFKESFPGLGEVSVSCAKEKTFKGNVPVVVPEAWNALPKKERDALLKRGVVQELPSYTGAFYGSVEVKLF